MNSYKDWQLCNSETFWCEVGGHSHVVQIYESDDALLSLLEDFVVGGIVAENAVIIIATKEHLQALEQRLRSYGLDVDGLYASGQYITLDGHETLSEFMVNGLPDYDLFTETVNRILGRVRFTGRKVRAFGEMVALLWEQGNRQGMMQLEQFWNHLFEKEAFPLLCAYPRHKFAENGDITLKDVCKAHHHLVTPTEESRFDLSYHDVH